MATKRVIAYFMHETEQAAAVHLLKAAEITDSFVMGEVEETDIASLREQGLVVQELPPAQAAPRQSDSERDQRRGLSVGRGAVAASRGFDAAIPAVVDFYEVVLKGPLVESWREQLQGAHVTLTESLADGGYKARLRSDQVQTVSALPFVHSVTWISPETSQPDVRTRSIPGAGMLPPSIGVRMLTFDIRLQEPGDSGKILAWLNNRNVAIAGASVRKIRFYALENSPVIDELFALPEVDTVSEHIAPKLYNDFARSLLAVDAASGSHPQTLLTQDGSDQIVAVADTGIDDQHPDFQGRIIGKVALGRPNDSSDPNGHGTHVAGSVLGDGSASQGKIKGIAPKAKLFFQSLLDANGGLGGLPLNLNDLFDEAYKAGARIHNNSWGANTASEYTLDGEEVDEYVFNHKDMLVVIAAGNEGTSGQHPVKADPGSVDWLSIGSPASCKNALTVGASRSNRPNGPLGNMTWGSGWPNDFPVNPIANEKISGDPESLAAFSSRGPCTDHRIKPDVVAPGTDILSARSSIAPAANFWGVYTDPHYAFDGGTSMATPLVSGCAALVRQYFVKDCGVAKPSAALLKATLVNSTKWLSGSDATAKPAGTPNYHQGHGRVTMNMAIPNPSQPNLQLRFVDDWQTFQFTRTGQRKRYQFVLPTAVPELRFCMAYTDAPARGLQNNVNLMVQHLESATKYLGNADLPEALTMPDADNNLEAIRIVNAAAGTYFVQVFAANLLKPPQDFALVVSGVGVPALTEI